MNNFAEEGEGEARSAQLEEIRKIHAERFRRSQGRPSEEEEEEEANENDEALREEEEEGRVLERSRSGGPLRTMMLPIGIGIARARRAISTAVHGSEEMEEEEDEGAVEDDQIIPRPRYLDDDEQLAMEVGRTGMNPEQLEQNYKDEVYARRLQIREQQHRRREDRRRDEVNEQAEDSMRRRGMRFEIQVGGPNGPVFRSVSVGGPSPASGAAVAASEIPGGGGGGWTTMNEVANLDPFLEIMREVLGDRAPGEAREDVLNDNNRFERAFRNMFRGIEQIEMHGGSPLPQGHQIRGFGDLINAMHHAAQMAAENGEVLADLPLTEEQMAAMETIAAKGNEGNNGNAASCSVCLSYIEQGEKMKKLPCDHMYHVACIDRWLTRSRACPMCKHDCTKPVSSNNRDPQQVRRSDMD